MQRPANTTRLAATLPEQYTQLIMNAFKAWERRIEGSPTWDDIDRLMEEIFKAINPEGSHG